MNFFADFSAPIARLLDLTGKAHATQAAAKREANKTAGATVQERNGCYYAVAPSKISNATAVTGTDAALLDTGALVTLTNHSVAICPAVRSESALSAYPERVFLRHHCQTRTLYFDALYQSAKHPLVAAAIEQVNNEDRAARLNRAAHTGFLQQMLTPATSLAQLR